MPPAVALGFGLLVAAGMALVFPYRSLEQEIARAPRQIDQLQIAYLRAWLTVRPGGAALRLELARQLLGVNDLDGARTELQQLRGIRDERLAERVVLLELDIARGELAALDPSDTRLPAQRQALHERLLELAQQRVVIAMVGEIDLELARRAAALGARDAAALLYARLLASTLRPGAVVWEEAARAMLALGDAETAAELYFAARRATPLRDEQRRLFLAGLRALLASGQPAAAVDAAELELGSLATDLEVLEFLTRLALAANRPDIAQRYAQILLKLSLLPAAIEARLARGLSVPAPWQALLAQMPARIVRVASPEAAQLQRTPRLPYDERLYELAFEVFLANNNLRDALAVAQAAVRQVPSQRRWRARLAQVADWSGQPQLALEQWHAIALASDDPQAWAEVERRAPGTFDTERWLQALRFAHTRRPDDLALVRRLVAAYEELGRPEQAIELLQALPPATDTIERRQRLELLAAVAERSGRDALREQTLRALVRDFGPRLPYVLGLANLAFARGDAEAAFRALAPAAANAGRPTDTDGITYEFWRAYAQLALLTGRPAEAEQALRLVAASPVASQQDHAALIALLQTEQPLEAALLAEQAYLRFGTPLLAMRALYLLDAHGSAARAHDFLKRLSVAQRVQLEREPDFLLQRAGLHLRLGEPRAALRDVRGALAIEPDAPQARAMLIWALLGAQAHDELRHWLLATAALPAQSAELDAPYAAAWLALHEPQRALRYLRPTAQDGRDPLWLAAMADAQEQLGQFELAWQFRRLAWLSPNEGAPAGGSPRQPRGTGALQLPAERRLLPLAPTFATGEAARARAYQLLLTDPTAATGEGRDAILGYMIARGLSEIASAWLERRYRDTLARPGWGELAVALANDDRPRIAHLLDTQAEWLPLYDRVDGAARVGRNAQAQTLVFDGMARLPDNEPLHQRLVDRTLGLLDAVPGAGLALDDFRQSPLDETAYEATGTVSLTPQLWLQARARRAERQSIDSAQLVDPPGETSATLTLGSLRDPARAWLASVQQRAALGRATGLLLQGRYEVAPRLGAAAGIGLAQPATDNVYLRVGGQRDMIDLSFDSRLSLREFAGLGASFSRIEAQGGGRLGSAQILRAELGHRVRLDYPDVAVRLVLTSYRYRPADGVASAMLPLLPPEDRPLATNATFMPPSTTQTALRVDCGESAFNAYVRAWRIFCAAALTHDTESGSGNDWLLGARGSVLGTDQLSLLARGGSTFGATRVPYTGFTIAYRYFF